MSGAFNHFRLCLPNLKVTTWEVNTLRILAVNFFVLDTYISNDVSISVVLLVGSSKSMAGIG